MHRGRPSLSSDDEERETNLPPLPPPWNADPRWYSGDFPPRAHNRLHALPHGEEYFSDLCHEMKAARHRVTIAGWALTPLMDLLREEQGSAGLFAEIVNEVTKHADVYILLWSGAPALFQPNTKSVEQAREKLLSIAPQAHCELDRTAAFSHDHHQKAASIDGRVAYVGGMDVSTFQGDRWDTDQHPLRYGVGWHDIQVRLEGETVADVEENFCRRWNAATGGNLEPLDSHVEPGCDTPAQVLTTTPKGFYPSFAPDGHFGIRHALLKGIAAARQFIYLENQYIWAPEIVTALQEAMDRNDAARFRIVLVLPAAAYDGRYDNDDHVKQLNKYDAGRGIFSAYSLYSAGPGQGITGHHYAPIYVHAKDVIVDDSWFLIGSANLNRRGLATDSEIAVQAVDPGTAKNLRLKLWAEHTGLTRDEIGAQEPHVIVDGPWKERAAETDKRRKAGDPPPPWQIHSYVFGGTPQSRLMDRLQSMTLEH